jgi:hypothetical protein
MVTFVKAIFLPPFELVTLKTASSVSPKKFLFIALTFLDTTLTTSVDLMLAIFASILIKISIL